MASVLVHTVVRGGRASPGSAAALSAARRIASDLGATLHAAAAQGDEPGEQIAVALGRAGADKVEVLPRADPGPIRWSCTGPALVHLARGLGPRVVLFGASDGVGDLAARLAASLGGAYFADAQLRGDRREPTLERYVDARRGALRLRLAALRVPLVATIGGRAHPGEGGDDDVDLRYAEPGVGDPLRWLGRAAVPDGPLDGADIVVAIGASVGPAERALAAELALRLGGELAGTAGAYRRGYVPLERAVGVGGRRIAPRIYVACGASGSPQHLAGVAPSTAIVALNRDPDATIFRAARYGMVGELADLLPRVIDSLGAAS